MQSGIEESSQVPVLERWTQHYDTYKNRCLFLENFKEIPSSIFQWRIQESLPPPIVYINQESSIPHCEEWKINNFQYVCSKRITMTNLTILMNVEQDDTNMMYRTYFPGINGASSLLDTSL